MAKHKYIETPEKLFEWFEEYRKKTKETPRVIYEYHGKDGEQRLKPLEVPLTIEGFKNFCHDKGCDINGYWNNVEGAYKEYLTICSRIRDIIRQDQIEGGMVGQFNPSITQRLNGLKEQTDNTNNTNINILNIDPLDDSTD